MLRAIRLTMDDGNFGSHVTQNLNRQPTWANTLMVLSFRRAAVLEACDVGDMLREIRLTMEEPEFILQVQNKLSKGRFWANQIVLLSFRRSAVLEALASGTVAAALRLVLKNASACSDEEINADNFISISPGVKLGDQTIGWVSESTIVRFPTVVDLAFLRILGGVSVVTISVLAEVVTFRWAAFSFGLTIGWVSGGTIVCFPTVVPFRWAAFSFGLTIGWVSGATIAPFGEVVALLRIIGWVSGATIVCFPTVVALLRIIGGVSVVTISVLAEVVTFRWAAFSFGLTIGWVSVVTIVCFPTVVTFRDFATTALCAALRGVSFSPISATQAVALRPASQAAVLSQTSKALCLAHHSEGTVLGQPCGPGLVRRQVLMLWGPPMLSPM
jgi:hypothetical protein